MAVVTYSSYLVGLLFLIVKLSIEINVRIVRHGGFIDSPVASKQGGSQFEPWLGQEVSL